MTSQQKILHIAGWSTCSFFNRATGILSSLATLFPTRLRIIPHTFSSRDDFRIWLIKQGFRDTIPDTRAATHTSSPFVWTSNSLLSTPPQAQDGTAVTEFIGGHDDTMSWCRTFCAPSSLAPKNEVTMVSDGHTQDHSYDYDLIIVGGGSGGLATAKEASQLGISKVAVLDYVKPSQRGTTWGLGGTCVNVGCIPKKLFHYASLVRESLHLDAPSFGITITEENNLEWETLKQNIQNHIKGLNFKYRVSLREQNIQYYNRLAQFQDPHTLLVTDKKGNLSKMTSSRFVIAVGGRPASLECEGSELAISSDDVFSLPHSPGKTLCVGASYIALECAGFLSGLGLNVTVAVRSILLRGFDRECADKIGEYMQKGCGIAFKRKVVPTKLEKMQDRIQVTFSDGTQDIYNTVLVAIGRNADTAKLGLSNVSIPTHPTNGKISTVHEQTPCPNIYALGDVMQNCPELTPVAIQAGIALSRRLFGVNQKQPMDYTNICTTVFTPMEYACVGYTEEEALQTFGKSNIDVYHKSFFPLEWKLSEDQARTDHPAFTKVIVDNTNHGKILGLHFVGPNAGEVVQGFGVAIKQGVTFQQLKETVGIHPTNAEEVVTLSVSKRSGKDAKATNC